MKRAVLLGGAALLALDVTLAFSSGSQLSGARSVILQATEISNLDACLQQGAMQWDAGNMCTVDMYMPSRHCGFFSRNV